MSNRLWLLLLYGLPAKKSAARVNLWRRLKKFGAIQLKSSAYVLPDNSANYERFQWLSRQIQDGGGEATLIRVAQIEGVSDQQIVDLFVEARAAEYREITRAGRLVLQSLRRAGTKNVERTVEKLRRRFDSVRAVDWVGTPAAHDAEVVLREIETRHFPGGAEEELPRLNVNRFKGKRWLTRPRPGIDRSGSAWLIRKFIDPKARFIFGTDLAQYPGAIAFDMLDAEFSHHGEDCTFETLVKRFDIQDPAVRQIAEMVHDADLEDGKFQRVECIGIDAVLTGWARSSISDADLLAKGVDCFAGLYLQLSRSTA